MSIQRVHLPLRKESPAFGRNHARSGKPFSERWAGKVALHTPEKADRRGTLLAKKHA
jgi:hypothetical protein